MHLLKQWESIVKISGVQLDESEDEEISVAYSAHLRTKDFHFGVESFGRGVCCATSEVVEDSRGMVPERLDDRAEVVVGVKPNFRCIC